jgi:hypothetical protein
MISTFRELVRSYLTITKDLGPVTPRMKLISRSWAISCTGKQVYAPQEKCFLLTSPFTKLIRMWPEPGHPGQLVVNLPCQSQSGICLEERSLVPAAVLGVTLIAVVTEYPGLYRQQREYSSRVDGG